MAKKYQDEGWLREKIEHEGISRCKIADELSVSHKTVMKYCKRFDIGDDLQKCPNCSHVSPQLGKHWAGSCEYPEFTDYQKNVLTGILMSDGSINHPSGNQNARFRVDMHEPSRPYLKYLSDEVFPVVTTEVKQGERAESKDRESNTFDVNIENCSDMYYLSSRRMPHFNQYLDWYDDGHKYWPCSDIQMNGTVFKHLYVGDGSLTERSGKSYISIAANDQWGIIDDVVEMFGQWVGKPSIIKSQRTNKYDVQINFNGEQTKEIFERMGSAVPGFEYKWPEKYQKHS
jgi:hypothetical protein